MEDNSGLIAFAKEIIQYAFDGMDADGAFIQELALHYGLLRREAYDPERHGPTLEDVAEGDDWLVMSGPLASKPAAS